MTPKQHILYDAIKAHWKIRGCSPTYRELQEICGHKSPATPYHMCQRLEAKGLIILGHGAHRSIELVPKQSETEKLLIRESFKLMDAMHRCDSVERYRAQGVVRSCLLLLARKPQYRAFTQKLLTFK